MKIKKNDLKFTVIPAAILLSAALAGTGLNSIINHKERKTQQIAIENRIDNRIPIPKENQALIKDPKYLSGHISLGYTLLTDMDCDGKWDAAEQVYAGWTTGNYYHKLLFKKGFGPSQSMPESIKVYTVEPNFFEKYELK
ncbi:MAG: hypothetical protein KKF46_02515 [Nanoarchaeota archaeon]|nr:hypothetical protein [Nanoarchaeota archaeon]MBU1321206.1 hypothetical protein [Nanoarchaeota archaeon]MBU1597011.1 hypothetical protein [Nanoarchaeota archaeon]MBU2441843.1 hypothetical protein [Nanoarchaeota archaeon]